MMEEKELINQIRQLAEIRPESEWVALTKSQILGAEKPRVFAWDWNFAFKLASLALPAMLAVVLAGFLVLNPGSSTSPLPEVQPSPENQLITTSLKAVEASLNQVSVDLEKLEESEKVLRARPALLSTIEESEKVVATIKEVSQKPAGNGEVLAALEGVESALGEVKQSYLEKEKKLVEDLLRDLGGRELTLEQTERLEAAQGYYGEADYSRALEEILRSF